MKKLYFYLKYFLICLAVSISFASDICDAGGNTLRVPFALEYSRESTVLEQLRNEQNEEEYYPIGSGTYLERTGHESILYKGDFYETSKFLRSNANFKQQARVFESEFKKLLAEWKRKYPVLEEEISGPVVFEIAENMPATCEMNAYNKTFRIDIATLKSHYLFKIETLEALDHLARTLLDERADKEAKTYYKFWAFEEFCSDYEKAIVFAEDYESLKENGGRKQEVLNLQAEALALLIEGKSEYIEVLFKAISKEHKDLLIEQLQARFKEGALKKFREMPTFTNNADLEFQIKRYAEKTYPADIYAQIEKLGYYNLANEIRTTFEYYRGLKGRYGRSYYHGINKINTGINSALRGEKAFFDVLIVVVEDKSEQETKELIEEARGKYISKDQKVVLVTQPTINTAREDMIKGNWSAVINVLLEKYPEYQDFIDKGSIAILLSAGTGSRNAGITQTGGGDKGKAACPNGMPYIQQVFRQAYQYWDKSTKGVVVLSNDSIEAISEPLKFGEYPISVLGSTLNLDDIALDGFGTILIDESAKAKKDKPILKLVEKATYAGRREVFGNDDNFQVPYNMAKYFFTWEAVKKIRDIFSELKDDGGKFLHRKYGFDQAGESIEAITGQTEEEYIKNKVKAGWTAKEAKIVRDANARLKEELGGQYGFINTGAFFIDTGDNAAYLKFGRDLTIRLQNDMDERERKTALIMKAARALLDLPEPDGEGRIIKVGTAYVDGREISGADLTTDAALMAKIEGNVLLVGDYVVIGDVEHAIPAESVFINPFIYKLGRSYDRGFVFFVEEPGELLVYSDVLITDINTKKGRVRIALPININAKDKLGAWSIIEDGPTNKKVFVTKGQVVGVSGGASKALLKEVRLKEMKSGTYLIDKDDNVLEKVSLVEEIGLWNLEIWPRLNKREGSPISFEEQKKGQAYSFQTMSADIDRQMLRFRYSQEHYGKFVKYVKMRKALESHVSNILKEHGSLAEKIGSVIKKAEESAPDSAIISCLNSLIKEEYFKLSDTEKIIVALVRQDAPFNNLDDNEIDLVEYLFSRLLMQTSPSLTEIRTSL
ncbi:MAG: hypothetical protein WC312_04280 [Candidatus Omnitrophota bacterium]